MKTLTEKALRKTTPGVDAEMQRRRFVARLRPKEPEAATMTAIGYVRVSTDEQALGPEAQRDAISKWCADHGFPLAAVYEDLGVSGTVATDLRDGWKALLRGIHEHDARIVVVLKLDRLARDMMVHAVAEAVLQKHGILLRSVAGEGTDAQDPAAMLMRRLIQAFSEYERGIIAARTAAALAVKRRKLERVGNVPFGFALAEDRVHLVAAPKEREAAAIVQKCVDGLGLGYTVTGHILSALGYPPRIGPKWHPQNIGRLRAVPVEGVDMRALTERLRAWAQAQPAKPRVLHDAATVILAA